MPRRRKPKTTPWGIGGDALALWTDAMMVVGMRVAKMAAGGPAAHREMQLMITEKMRASSEIGSAATAGTLGQGADAAVRAMAILAPKVRANRRRLAARR